VKLIRRTVGDTSSNARHREERYSNEFWRAYRGFGASNAAKSGQSEHQNRAGRNPAMSTPNGHSGKLSTTAMTTDIAASNSRHRYAKAGFREKPQVRFWPQIWFSVTPE
jgi:hypothetical protein